MLIEILGMAASMMILLSMSFNSVTKRNNIIMRILNIIGSCGFVVYGLFLHAWSTLFLNLVMVFVNLYYTIRMSRE